MTNDPEGGVGSEEEDGAGGPVVRRERERSELTHSDKGRTPPAMEVIWYCNMAFGAVSPSEAVRRTTIMSSRTSSSIVAL